MDQYKHLIPSSETIDLNQDVDWDDADDIEIGSDEHDLFLHEDYIKSSCKDVIPFKAKSKNNAQQQSVPNGQLPSDRSQLLENNNQDKYSMNQMEAFELITGPGLVNSPSPSSSIMYRAPNYHQFAGNLAPSSPASIIVSMIIVIVILSVTILPIIFLPQQTTPINSQRTRDNVINSNKNQIIEHADARCKCICPPFQVTENKNKSSTSMVSANNNNSNNNTKNNITIINPDTKSKIVSNANVSKRRLYVGNTSPNQCNCNNIVQPHITDNKIILKDFCSSCECRYQSRNTATIKRNVIFFIIVLFGLGIFTLIQCLFKYFRITRRNLPRQFGWLSHQLSENE